MADTPEILAKKLEALADSFEGVLAPNAAGDVVMLRAAARAVVPDAKRALAIAAAHQASEAAAELLRYAREGEWLDGPFHPDVEPLEKLCDAAKMAAEVMDGEPDPDGDRNQVVGALEKYLSGWA